MTLKLFPLLVAVPALMLGNTYTYVTPTGSLDPGGTGNPVNAQAVITTTLNTVTIDLSNLLTASQMKDAGQLLSDLSFSMDNSLTAFTPAYTSSANLLSVAADGSSSASGSGVAVGWGFTNTGAGTFHLDGISGDSNPSATKTIIGGTAGNTYANANNSIQDNNGHNPFIASTAHFVLTIAGVGTGTVINSAIFSFGTVGSNNITGCLAGSAGCTPVPEPSFAYLLGGLLVGFAALRKKFATA